MKAIGIAFIASGVLQNSAHAQCPPTIVLPGNTNVTWYTTSNPIQGINTAMIKKGSGFIFASAYYDGTTSPTIYVGGLASITSTGAMASVPDIIIGNSTGGGGTICPSCSAANDNIIATAFVNNSGNVEIDFYRYRDDGVHPITFTALPLATKTITGYSPQTVHIDVIAASGSNCNKYAITWDDFSSSSPVIYAAYGDINANTLGTPQLITPASSYGHTPDVAAVQRGGFSTDDWALITYVDNGGNTLYYSEWDMTASSTPTRTTLDNGSLSTGISLPRIDAIDDHTKNGNSSNANYEIVAQSIVGSGGETKVGTYNNVITPPNWTSEGISLLGVAGYHHPPSSLIHFAPTVAVGTDGAGGYNYMVEHYTADSLSYPDSCFLFTEPLNYTASTSYVGNKIYWVDNDNSSLYAIDGGDCSYANAVCTAPDDPTQPGIFAWAFYNGTSYEVDYKRCFTAGASISFKPGPSNTSVNSVVGNDWHIYPNPVADILRVNTIGASSDVTYQITDIVGHTILRGNIVANNQDIDVNKLLPGSYIINIFTENNIAAHSVFIKN